MHVHVHELCTHVYLLSGFSAGTCRMKVTSKLMKKFRDPEAALQFLETHSSRHAPSPGIPPILHHRDTSTHTNSSTSDIVGQMKTLLGTLSAAAVGQLLQFLAPPDVTVPPEFVSHSLACMETLKQAGRSNILAGLAKALGSMRPDGIDSRMPVSQMPVGLIEYAASFFSSDSLHQVHVHVTIL